MINIFPSPKPVVSSEQLQQVKDWLYELLPIDKDTIISLSQLPAKLSANSYCDRHYDQ